MLLWVIGVTSALLLALWVSSGWLHARWVGAQGHGFSVGTGKLIVARGSPPPFPGWHFQASGWRSPRWEFWFVYFNLGPGRVTAWWVHIPLWAPLVLSTVPTVFLARSVKKNRQRPGACASCGYDRQGLTSTAECPECGMKA